MIKIKLKRIEKLLGPKDEWILEEGKLPKEYFMVTRIKAPMYLDDNKMPEEYYAWRIDEPFYINDEKHDGGEHLIFDHIRNGIKTIKCDEFDSEYKAELPSPFEFEVEKEAHGSIYSMTCKERKTGKLICTLSAIEEMNDTKKLLLESYDGNKLEYVIDETTKTIVDRSVLSLSINQWTVLLVVESYNNQTQDFILRLDFGGYYRKFSYNYETGTIKDLLTQSYTKDLDIVFSIGEPSE